MKYKNISDQDLTLPHVGFVKAGEEIESASVIENPNLKLVTTVQAPQQSQPQVNIQPKKEEKEGESE